jgi:uncharacterized protein YukE
VSLIQYNPAAMETAITNVNRTHAQLLAKGAEFRSLWAQVGAVFNGSTAAAAAAVNQHIHTASVQHHDALGALGGAINVAHLNLGNADTRNAASWSGGGTAKR